MRVRQPGPLGYSAGRSKDLWIPLIACLISWAFACLIIAIWQVFFNGKNGLIKRMYAPRNRASHKNILHQTAWYYFADQTMPKLNDAIDNVFSEARMLLLGGQVLLGFSFRICFEKKFEQITRPAQLAEMIALAS